MGPEARKRHGIAKISPPDSSGALPRKRLFSLLDACRKKPVVWVTGPAGSGKTTLVSGYLKDRKLASLWYQVDEGDRDVASFFYYVGLAAKKAAPRHRKPLPLLTPEYLQGVPTFTRRYFEELFRRLTPPRSPSLTKRGMGGVIMVLDNFQDASSAAFHEMVGNALEAIPAGITVIILSRSEPPGPLSRLRAHGRIAMIGWNELRFSLTECRDFTKSKNSRRLPNELAGQLHETTEGWAAGLVLMMEMARTVEIHFTLVSELSRESVFNYFANEIFEKADEETRDFLLKTSFFPSMSAAAAGRLTGNAGARSILSRLSRDHYFTDWRPLPAPAFQYHPLFREFLQSLAKSIFGREKLADILRRTGRILQEDCRADEAAILYMNAEAWDDLADLSLAHAQSLIGQGRHKTLEEWLCALPGKVLDSSPWLLYWLCACRIAFNPLEARSYATKAFALFKERGDQSGLYLSWASVIDTFVYAWSDFNMVDSWIAEFRELSRPCPAFASPEIEARATSGIFSALFWRQPRHPDLPMWAERLSDIVLGKGDFSMRVALGNNLAHYYIWMGDFSKAALVIDSLREAARDPAVEPLALQWWWGMAAAYSFFIADREACLDSISKGVALGEKTGVHLLDFFLFAQGIYSGLTQGDIALAEGLLKRIAALNSTRTIDKSLYHYMASSVSWYRSDLQLAREHGEQSVRFSAKAGCPFTEALCRMELAITLFDMNRHKEADRELAMATEMMKGLGHTYFLCLLFRAWFALQKGETANGIKKLRAALKTAAEQGYLNFTRWKPEMMSYLCAKALENDIEPDYVKRLIRIRGLVPPPDCSCDIWPYPITIKTLGNFELVIDDEPVEFALKGRQKPLAMLKALIAMGEDVSMQRLTDVLWPDAEGDLAQKSFEITLQRLRRLLGVEGIVRLKGGVVSLDPGYCRVDVRVFEDICDKLKGRFEVRLAERAIHLYRGDFLENETEHPWAASMREKMRARIMQLLVSLGRRWEQERQWDRAIVCYEKGIEIDALAEEFYLNLMTCYEKLGRKAEAIRAYQRCCSALASALDVSPSEDTRAVYLRIKVL